MSQPRGGTLRLFLAAILICLPAVATAQLCEGGPAFTRGPFQVRADALINNVTSTFSAGVGVGHRLVFGQFVAGRRFIAEAGGTATPIGGRAGLQASEGRLHVCPVVTVGRVSGPKSYDLYGDGYRFDIDSKNSSYGLAVGVVASPDNELKVVPTVSFTRAQATVDVYDPQTDRTETTKGTISLLDLGVGLVSRGGFSARPDILVPVGAGNNATSFGITVGVNF